MEKLKELFKTYFGTGLLVIIPIAVTMWIVRGTVLWLDEVLAVQRWSPIVVPGLGVGLALIGILVAGVIGRNVIGGWLVANMSELLKRIPIVGSVYGGLRQTLQALFSGGEKRFGGAVLVEFPRPGSWTVGFITSNRLPPQIEKELQFPHLTIFVPATPNPTSGFLIFVTKDQVRPLDMKVEEALKLVVSLGLVESPVRNSMQNPNPIGSV